MRWLAWCAVLGALGCGTADDARSVGMAEGPLLALPYASQLGAFSLVLRDTGVLITHTDHPEHVLFATHANSPIEVIEADLRNSEHQGSFTVTPVVTRACTQSRFRSVRRDGDALRLQVAFADADPVCRALEASLRFSLVAPDQLAFGVDTNDRRFDAVALRVESAPDERMYGMGMQAPAARLDLKGRELEVLTQEGGIGRGQLPITPAVNLVSPGSGGSEGASYYAAAHYLTNQQRSLLLENEQYARFDFRAPSHTRITVYAESMRGRILAGDSPLALIQTFTAFAGRMPELPDWVHEGAIVALAKTPAESVPLVDRLLAGDAALSAVWNQTWSGSSRTFVGEQVLWNWIQNPRTRPGWPAYVDALAARGLRTLCYLNPMFRDVPEDELPVRRNLFREGMDAGYFVKDDAGDVLMLALTAFEVALLDVTNPDAQRWLKDIVKDELLGHARCDGYMADFAEALPFAARMWDGRSGADFHNAYPVAWARLQREAVEEAGLLGEALVFHRAGHTRSPAHALAFWQGDQLTTWDRHDGLENALHGLLNGGFSGIAINHSDTGGYTSLSRAGLGYLRERELLMRWTELNAFTAILRTHEGNQPADNPQVYSDDDTVAHFARMSRVYRALGFLRRALVREASLRGTPVVRHLFMHHPDDARAQTSDDAFLLGPDLLVSPVLSKCVTRPLCLDLHRTYLPKGRWVHLWSGRVFGHEARGGDVTVHAPLGQPPVFYREGSEVGATLVANLAREGIRVPAFQGR